MGAEALKKLNELLVREFNILNVTDIEVQRKAINLLLQWIGSIYEMTIKPEEITPDVDFNKLFKVKNN